MHATITNNFHKPIDAPPETAYAALARLDTFRPFQEALAALGVGERLISLHRHEAPRRSTASSLVWRLAGGGRAEMAWTASVRGDGDGGSLLSIAVRAGAGDEAHCDQFHAAWPVLGRLVEMHAQHALLAVSQLADELEAERGVATAVPLAAVG